MQGGVDKEVEPHELETRGQRPPRGAMEREAETSGFTSHRGQGGGKRHGGVLVQSSVMRGKPSREDRLRYLSPPYSGKAVHQVAEQNLGGHCSTPSPFLPSPHQGVISLLTQVYPQPLEVPHLAVLVLCVVGHVRSGDDAVLTDNVVAVVAIPAEQDQAAGVQVHPQRVHTGDHRPNADAKLETVDQEGVLDVLLSHNVRTHLPSRQQQQQQQQGVCVCAVGDGQGKSSSRISSPLERYGTVCMTSHLFFFPNLLCCLCLFILGQHLLHSHVSTNELETLSCSRKKHAMLKRIRS